MINITEQQRAALQRAWQRDGQGRDFADFIASAQSTFGMDGAVVVQWCGMWLAIEADGYTHS